MVLKTCLVTGAGGFVGNHLCRVLSQEGYLVKACIRNRKGISETGSAVRYIPVGDIDGSTNWSGVLDGVDFIVHLAARVHVMEETSRDPLTAFRKTNVDGTSRLAEQAADAGTRRFIFVSSIKVNGEDTSDMPFRAKDVPDPQDPYAVSKLEAEQALSGISAETGMETVVIRPPLVFGPGVGGNFLRLMKLVEKGMPLPLGSVKNRRSVLGVYNLCDLLRCCLEHPDASGQVFLAGDPCAFSTPELIRLLCRAMGRPCRLFRVPLPLLRAAAEIAGRGRDFRRLCTSLVVDTEKVGNLLGWTPPRKTVDEINMTVSWYINRHT
ncbi:MAG TPA: SDR family oxidoreductase [Thermodesulfobacteriaceae bacterium]|nr:SDR family oxidoreductase [Thermodesulfobacteriaceae bacterium]